MKPYLITEDSVSADPNSIDTVTRKMLRERAVELAGIAGRPPQDVSKSDWEQAKLELMSDQVTEQEQTSTPSTDEDDEGMADKEPLVEEGTQT